MRDHLLINSNLTIGYFNDNYIELIFKSNKQELVDCNSFVLETMIQIIKPDGDDLDDAVKISVIDGLGHRFLSRCTIFFNGGVSCELNFFLAYSIA